MTSGLIAGFKCLKVGGVARYKLQKTDELLTSANMLGPKPYTEGRVKLQHCHILTYHHSMSFAITVTRKLIFTSLVSKLGAPSLTRHLSGHRVAASFLYDFRKYGKLCEQLLCGLGGCSCWQFLTEIRLLYIYSTIYIYIYMSVLFLGWCTYTREVKKVAQKGSAV
jgi:hypothetical protein